MKTFKTDCILYTVEYIEIKIGGGTMGHTDTTRKVALFYEFYEYFTLRNGLRISREEPNYN